MSSTIDPAKLKVVELRAELSKRGLDSKGNKPALVKRLKDALEEELKEELPDTSIADTSTEDLDTTLPQEKPSEEESKEPDEKTDVKNEDNQPTVPPESEDTKVEPVDDEPKEQKMEVDAVQDPPQESVPAETKPSESEDQPSSEEKQEATTDLPAESKENGNQDEGESVEVDSKADNEKADNSQSETIDDSKSKEDTTLKGVKRKHSPSPERSQRRRSKSPIKEDEPPIDNNKVQLSWYDSDLHLQVDKESFLSAKPYLNAAFGYVWSGVRATHGVNAGKVCFEVKVTEELKWENFARFYESPKRKSKHDKKKSDTTQKGEENEKDVEKSANGVNPEETTKADSEPVKQDEKSEEAKTDTTEVEKSEESKPEEPMETDENKAGSEKQEDNSENKQVENKEEGEPLPVHLFRVGWSLLGTTLQLGEEKYSYGYESSGKFVTENNFVDYGIKFSAGDVVGSFLNIADENITISYTVNGVAQPVAITVTKSDLPENFVLFPHVLTRNCAFELNLGSREEPWFSKPDELADYEFIDKIENLVSGPVRPENRNDCEVILMCGIPASGKTHWVQEHLKANPDTRYTVLGASQLLERMTLDGKPLKSKYKYKWDVLLHKVDQCLDTLLEIAPLRRRNYIIDQTNVFPSAQRRKMRPFGGFKRRAVVIVVGDEEQAKRQSLQEAQGGKHHRDNSVLEMKADMGLPQKCEWLDEVTYAGVNEEEAKTLVKKYNTEGYDAGFGFKRFSQRGDRHRWQNRRNDYRRDNYRDRNYHNNRYDRRQPRWPQRGTGSSWNRDRRDNRGPPAGAPRDWRVRESYDRGNRDSQGGNYNRNRNQSGRGSSGNWQSGGWGQGSWGNQAWGGQGTWSQGGWNNQNQNHWKYGGGSGQGYGGYGSWNYYGQYPQNWNSQGQAQTTSAATGTSAGQYGQYSQEWAQYAQQYAQNTSTTTTQSTQQK